jgi:hypothetical protein
LSDYDPANSIFYLVAYLYLFNKNKIIAVKVRFFK